MLHRTRCPAHRSARTPFRTSPTPRRPPRAGRADDEVRGQGDRWSQPQRDQDRARYQHRQAGGPWTWVSRPNPAAVTAVPAAEGGRSDHEQRGRRERGANRRTGSGASKEPRTSPPADGTVRRPVHSGGSTSTR